jgi:hypothetical protein
MNINMRNIKINKILLASLAGAFILTGCGKTSSEDKEIAAFSSSVADFTSYLTDAGEKINNLDTTQSESCDELLEILDEMGEEFEKLASLDVPDSYDGFSTLAQNASANMSSAVSYYHLVYDSDEGEFDYDASQTAYEYYMRAMLEVECIGYILSNQDIPDTLLEDAGIHVTVSGESSDESILNKWLGDDSSTDDANTDNGDVQIISE